MGGPGSTRWRNHQPAPLVEESLRIDLLEPQLKLALSKPEESAVLTSFSVNGQLHSTWLLQLSPATEDEPRKLIIRRADKLKEPQTFELRPVRVGFTDRTHVVCPGCEKTARVLFALREKGFFECKRCLGVQYESVRRHDKRIDAICRRLRAGDHSVVEEYDTLGCRPGYAGFVADRLLLTAVSKVCA